MTVPAVYYIFVCVEQTLGVLNQIQADDFDKINIKKADAFRHYIVNISINVSYEKLLITGKQNFATFVKFQ